MARATTGLSYLTFGAVVLGSLVFTVFITVPQFSQYQNANTKLALAFQREEENTAFLSNLDLRAQDLEKHSADVKALNLALPDKFMQSNLWVNINELAVKAGVRVGQIDASKKETETQKVASAGLPVTANTILANGEGGVTQNTDTTNASSSVKLEKWVTGIKVQGSYAQIRAFITNLEKSLILSDLKDLKLSPVSSADKTVASDLLEATMTVRTYVQP